MSAVLHRSEIEESEDPVDEFVAALAWHRGDKDATIRTLLEDCRHLRQQLTLAGATMSVGFARGWRPALERSLDAEA
ncbi:hypothetical protein IB262_30975 [Ensifer sp. ENS02]|uniref:hypothetical protein n=1 Tax=Ensifer sp. ENS02 TaxID=2769290 RepID=UPI001780AAA8|nr:hypothetical protein [Ensifer sp. ENS02]MBD9524308.1 hypothetical protein [Ensifer sp. ENS02]